MESGSAVHVHPVVLASIVDAYERRAEGSERVIGTLLGTWGKGIIEVTHCYSALYQESAADVCMDLEFGNSMAALERKVNHSHCIVGWYATGNEITVPYKVIHQDYYMHKSKNAILLLVDTNMSFGDKMSTKAFLCRHMGIPGGKRGSIFVPVEVEVECYGPERCAVEMMVSSIDPRSKLQPEVSCLLILSLIGLVLFSSIYTLVLGISGENSPWYYPTYNFYSVFLIFGKTSVCCQKRSTSLFKLYISSTFIVKHLIYERDFYVYQILYFHDALWMLQIDRHVRSRMTWRFYLRLVGPPNTQL
ncbi:Eukaryotic translation initiation factor 3 subunit F [Schistosoma japonicum]|nr:Eukaryotic translation initiation factor 3 subunit F [Schistosoma japonicum]